MVRFSSPALKAVSVGTKKLSKEFLLDLLTKNANAEMNCRFAIEDDGKVVVLVDQLLETLDDAEFRRHVAHVAQVADEFELSRDGDHEIPTVG